VRGVGPEVRDGAVGVQRAGGGREREGGGVLLDCLGVVPVFVERLRGTGGL
jgi:hypothetical protein